MCGSSLTVRRLVDQARKAALAISMAALLAQPGFAGQTSAQAFTSAEAASQALYLALEKKDEPAITAILGGDAELTSAGDEELDKLERERFAQKYREMHRIGSEPDGRAVLYIGAENWPFPIPLVAENGVWRFDAEEGRKEVLQRRVGRNEIAAIATCHALVAAERQQRGKPKATTAVAALLAKIRGGETSAPSNGYRFRMLTSGTPSRSVAFVAYPAAYRSSGVMTFIVGEDDVVHEKDLGSDTAQLVRAITTENPDSTWTVSTP